MNISITASDSFSFSLAIFTRFIRIAFGPQLKLISGATFYLMSVAVYARPAHLRAKKLPILAILGMKGEIKMKEKRKVKEFLFYLDYYLIILLERGYEK